MSRTVSTEVVMGVLCTAADFYTVTGTVRACAQGHRSRSAYCPTCGGAVGDRPVEEPTPAFAPRVPKGLQPSDALHEAVDDSKESGIHHGHRLQSYGPPTAFIVGVQVAQVREWDCNTDTPLSLDVTDDHRAHARRLADLYGIDPERPIGLFLSLYAS